MPEFNDKELKLSKGLVPAPQHWNPDAQDYEVVKGTDGATHMQLKGDGVNPDGSLNVVVKREASTDAAITDPTLSANDISLLKGVLKQLQGGGTGALPTQLTGSNVKLLDAVTATGRGTPQAVGSFKSYVFEVFGTASSFTIQLEAIGPSGTVRTINKVWDELNNGFLTGSSITTPGFYSVSVPSFSQVQANLSTVTGGNVSVSGGLMP